MLRSVGWLLAKENIVLVFWAEILHVVTLFHNFILVPLDKSDQRREDREEREVRQSFKWLFIANIAHLCSRNLKSRLQLNRKLI